MIAAPSSTIAARIARLMIVGRKRKRHQDRRPPGRLDFRHGRRARPRNDQVGRGILLMKLAEKRAHIRIEACFRIGRAHFLELCFSPV